MSFWTYWTWLNETCFCFLYIFMFSIGNLNYHVFKKKKKNKKTKLIAPYEFVFIIYVLFFGNFHWKKIRFYYFFFLNDQSEWNKSYEQGLPVYSTIMRREFIHIAYALLFSRHQTATSIHTSADAIIHFLKFFLFIYLFFFFIQSLICS